MASGKTLKKRNACLHAVRSAVKKEIAGLNGLRSEGVKFPYDMTSLKMGKGQLLIFA